MQKLEPPGTNVTGLAGQAAELSGKRLELLSQLVPDVHTVAVLGNRPHRFQWLAHAGGRRTETSEGRKPREIARPGVTTVTGGHTKTFTDADFTAAQNGEVATRDGYHASEGIVRLLSIAFR